LARKLSISIVGAGNVGSVLAPALRRAGYRVQEIVVRDKRASIRRGNLVARSSAAKAVTDAMATFSADVIWVCVTDDAIASVARTLAQRQDVDWRGKIVFHASGALTSDELKALKKRGAAIASTHFMQSFVPGSNPSLAVPFAVEGDKQATSRAVEIGRALGAKPFVIRKQSKVLYHAMGFFSSPLVIIALSLSESVGRKAGLNSKQIESVIKPMFSRTAENYLKKGSAGAFVGPINRGNIATVQKHLRELRRIPEAHAAYVAMGRAALKMLPVKNRKQLEVLFRKG
jgi:predicted short-subunit dehydrogenase-like oxidoreductase (DUF2520 family)